MTGPNHPEAEDAEPDGEKPQDHPVPWNELLPLIAFAVEGQDSARTLMVLALILILRTLI